MTDIKLRKYFVEYLHTFKIKVWDTRCNTSAWPFI